MRRNLSLLFFILALQAQGQFQNKIDLKKMFSGQDMVFDSLSDKWEEGAFLGNGLLGVMVYRENANAIRFDLGRTDVTDHREGINPSIGRARLPIGRFILSSAFPVTNIKMRLDLWN